jgi:hypothetical protein
MTSKKEYLDETASVKKLFALDQELIKKTYNIDKKIQNFYNANYDYKNLKIEYGTPMLERKKTGPIDKNPKIDVLGEADIRESRMKELDSKMKHIKRKLTRIEKELNNRRCTSSKRISNKSLYCSVKEEKDSKTSAT